MRVWRVAVGVLALAFFASIGRAQAPSSGGGLALAAGLLEGPSGGETTGPALTLDEAQRIALAANPEIQVAARRLAMARAHVPVAGALDDPTAMYRGWGVPLQKPWDFNAAQNMFSLSQTLPGGNKRALRTDVAQSDVEQAKANLDEVRLEIEVRVRRAFNDLLLVQDELRIHDEHVSIARQAIEAARIRYTVGNVPQQDVLKAQVALTALAEHMIRFNRDADVARARLNTLLGRDPATPVMVRGRHAVLEPLPAGAALEKVALDQRPDLVAARAAAQRSHQEQALAKKAYAPDFTVSAGYMLMPSGQDMRNDYMVEGSMNLPWLNRRRHNAEIAEAAAKATEQDAELAALRNSARGQIEEALAEAQAAQKTALFYQNQLQPQAEATLKSSVIAYENNKASFLDLLDSQMTVIQVDLDWVGAVGDFDTRLANLELATGASLEQAPQTEPEVRP